MKRAALLEIVLCAASLTLAQDAEDGLVIMLRSSVREIIVELNRLRGEVNKLQDRLLGCQA